MSYLRETPLDEKDFPTLQLLKADYGFIPNFFLAQTSRPDIIDAEVQSNYSFNDNFFTQDLRLSRTFLLGSEHVRFVLIGEIFNLFNTANLIQYSGNIADTAAFGQPGARFNQVFGSGGPRAFQFGARLSF